MLLVAAAGVRAEQRAHPQAVAGEREDRAAVEAAEDEAEQRQQRVAGRHVQDQEDRVRPRRGSSASEKRPRR